MPFSISVEADIKDIKKDLWMIEHRHTADAIRTSLNRTATTIISVRKGAVKEIVDKLKLGKNANKVIRAKLSRGTARRNRLSVPIYVKLRGINIALLDAQQNTTGVQAAGTQYLGAFLLEAGHVAKHSGRKFPKGIVFRRKTAGQYKSDVGRKSFQQRKGRGRKWGEPELPVKAVRLAHAHVTVPVIKSWVRFRGAVIFRRHFETAMRYALHKSARGSTSRRAA